MHGCSIAIEACRPYHSLKDGFGNIKTNAEYEVKTTQVDKNQAVKLDIADRAEIMPKSESYMQYKDHKEDFVNKKSVRIINPNKSDLGKVSKINVEKIMKS